MCIRDRNISLDFFGTDIIQSVGVNKAFNAGGSSDGGGATIDIVSKERIGSGNLGFGISGGDVYKRQGNLTSVIAARSLLDTYFEDLK